ncbi:ABC transporter permease [Ignatzschineria indica]|uniref:methionine ABC transporter permease n=1 Tax=Ignatzschineria indica TaxID=472583 RepID=UPI0025787F07|nr:methionine ABC transporter permease [Ignatzschineria indica]MDM1545151.1 ABC transporter permease [Ignatzschineria indica]
MTEFINALNNTQYWNIIWDNTLVTLIMLGFTWFFTILIGLPWGVALYLTSPTQLLSAPKFYRLFSFLTNTLRSIPFLILIVVLLPLTFKLMGTKMGIKGAIFPLVIGSAPFFARLAETSFREVDRGVIEAAQSMGTPLRTIIMKVLLPEARPSLIAGITITGILILSYTAMAGTVGAGGLGDIAVRYGFHRNMSELMYLIVIVLIIIVQIMQWVGDWLVRHYTRK